MLKNLADAAKATTAVVNPADTIYVAVGARVKIEAGLNELARSRATGR